MSAKTKGVVIGVVIGVAVCHLYMRSQQQQGPVKTS